uniref:Uncharacterized protein n=1 Tax=Siphoviridae sp. ctAjZ17 TaxID=2827797 RepID=A0A8S5SPU5_9CAUD|nr:MAG TPA: hypothetical protein [Siphoviridae sp. ctAjZ17]
MALISILCVALFQPFVLLFVSYRTVRSNFLIHTFFCFIVERSSPPGCCFCNGPFPFYSPELYVW